MFCHKRTSVSFEMLYTMAQIIKQWSVCNFTIFTLAFVSMLCSMVNYQITCIMCHSTVKNRFIWGIFVSIVFSTLSSKKQIICLFKIVTYLNEMNDIYEIGFICNALLVLLVAAINKGIYLTAKHCFVFTCTMY